MKPLHVLLVEDDDSDAQAMRRSLDKAKIANPIRRAVDGVEALEILRGSNGKEKLLAPYILLIDLRMPRMDGISLLKEIRRDPVLHKTIAFILTTSKYDQDKADAYNLNVAGYIVKEKLGGNFEQLARLLGFYRLIVDLP